MRLRRVKGNSLPAMVLAQPGGDVGADGTAQCLAADCAPEKGRAIVHKRPDSSSSCTVWA